MNFVPLALHATADSRRSKFVCSLGSYGVLLHDVPQQYFNLCCQLCLCLASHDSSHRNGKWKEDAR